MNIVFGKRLDIILDYSYIDNCAGTLVTDFNNYFIPGTDVTEDEFRSSVNQSA